MYKMKLVFTIRVISDREWIEEIAYVQNEIILYN